MSDQSSLSFSSYTPVLVQVLRANITFARDAFFSSQRLALSFIEGFVHNNQSYNMVKENQPSCTYRV